MKLYRSWWTPLSWLGIWAIVGAFVASLLVTLATKLEGVIGPRMFTLLSVGVFVVIFAVPLISWIKNRHIKCPDVVSAASGGYIDEVITLIDEGTDLNAKGPIGMTALMFAAGQGNINIAQILLNAGADVNAKNDEGATALMFAASEGHAEVMKELLAAGADVNAKSMDGGTALHAARDNGHTNIVVLLKQAGAKESLE